jgi:anti-sigma factor RsiW
MAIRYTKQHAGLSGQVSAEDAEALARWLGQQAHPAVELKHCEGLHAAVLQVLLALRPRLKSPPPDTRLAQLLQQLPH